MLILTHVIWDVIHFLVALFIDFFSFELVLD